MPALRVLTALTALAIATMVRAQSPDPLAAHRGAVAAARAALDSAVARRATDVARRVQLPVIRTLAGLEVRGDTTTIPRAVLRAIDAEFAGAFAGARAFFGPPADTLLRGILLTITPKRDDSDSARSPAPLKFVDFVSGGRAGHRFTHVAVDPVDAELVREHFASWFSESAAGYLPPAIKFWAHAGIPDGRNEWVQDREQYVRLATSPLPLARACFEGSLLACRSALAVVRNVDTIDAWLSPGTRRAFVRDHASSFHDSDARRACIADRHDWACREILQYSVLLSPSTNATRQYLVRHAILRGGQDAFRRLVGAQSSDVGALLETTAGVPLDTLLGEWRTRILAQRTPPPTPDASELGIAAIVGVAAVGLAARRRP
jgi:hypothetical protein